MNARSNSKQNPVFGILYGRPKTGKTLATLRAFPNGLFIAPRGGLSCKSWIDWEPACSEATDVEQLIQVLSDKKTNVAQYSAIIIDDFSIIADAELTKLRKTHKVVWDAYAVLSDRVCEFRDLARKLPCHVFLTMHEQPPREVKKVGGVKYIPGSPSIGGHKLPEKLPALVDFVARVTYNPDYGGSWPYVYQVAPDEHYVTGDRLSICPGIFSLNLREMLLAAGYSLPRPKELEWTEKVVDKLYPAILEEMRKEDPDYKKILTKVANQLKDKNQKHVRWALSDAFDRARLAYHNTNLINTFIDSFETVEL